MGEKDPEAEFWDGRYSAGELVWSAGPNAFLVEHAAGLEPGTALDLGCGEGRNALWLAEHGWEAVGVDFSGAGIDKARRIGERRGVTVEWHCADATTWQPDDPGTRFDLVAVFYLQLPAGKRRLAMANAWSLVAPGGLLLLVAHDTRNLTDGVGGPQNASVLFSAADVLEDLRSAGGFDDAAVEQAGTVERAVDGSDTPAIDCLVRVRHP